MSSFLHVAAVFKVKPEGLEAMLRLLTALTRATQEEPGCVDYGYLQAVDDPLLFSSFEIWRSAEDEALHWQTEHLQQALAQAADLLQGVPQINRYQRVC
ncbi:putative quinol monooxygenase [Pseudomonas sp. NPDC090202]|uniref:putative quinol monooxygenase n=1 Tax=unclassified Pseudomonas TaxID=196821 RepID=UPI0038165B07